jgi:hypothetical protein
LIERLREHPGTVHNGEAMLGELERVRDELAAAHRRNVKFRFAFIL